MRTNRVREMVCDFVGEKKKGGGGGGRLKRKEGAKRSKKVTVPN